MTTSTQTLQSAYRVPSADLQRLNEQGFVKLNGVLDPVTVREYETEITSQVFELNTQDLPLEERDTYGKAFLQIGNLWTHSEVVREFAFSKRLAGIAADLLGVKAVRLYADQALYKESGGGITPWHADQFYWPLSTDRAITAWVPLQQTPLEMGPLSFAVGSHKLDDGNDLHISDESEATLKATLAERDYPIFEEPFELGDVSFHLGWTFHRAGENLSGAPRAVMTMIYVDADITVTEPANQFQQEALELSMPGASVGGVPDGHLNPILFGRG